MHASDTPPLVAHLQGFVPSAPTLATMLRLIVLTALVCTAMWVLVQAINAGPVVAACNTLEAARSTVVMEMPLQ